MKYLILPICLLLSNPVFACHLDQAEVKTLDSGLGIFYRVEEPPVRVAEHFAMRLKFCQHGEAVDVSELTFDASMPAHGHGMNYRPQIIKLSDGQYLVEGLLFHMPGHWELNLRFEEKAAATTVAIEFPVH